MKQTMTKIAPPASEDIGWRQFPMFEELLGHDVPSPLLAKVESTCRQLDNMLKSGSEPDKSRARLAMTAYGRSLDLLRGLTEFRDKTLRQR